MGSSGTPTWRRALILVPIVGFVGLLAYGIFTAPPDRIRVGAEAPDFDLPLLDGEGSISKEDLDGHPVVINFFASWCLPCRDEAPILREAAQRYEDDGVIFIGVNIRDARSRAKLFVEEFDLDFDIVRDEQLRLANELGVYGIPETFFIDHEGKFVGLVAGREQGENQGTVVLGAISREQLDDNIEILIRRAADSGA